MSNLVWKRFGDVPNYVEPFFGSGAVLLCRSHEPRVETVNDLDCYVANFWRALQAEPDGVAQWCDWPVNEADLHARHAWLLDRSEFRARMHTEIDYYDAKIAGWWVWGICQWIGSGWCAQEFYNGGEWQQRPHLGDPGMGVHRPSQQLPKMNAPHVWTRGHSDVYEYFNALASRLRRVRVCCGDWSRVLGESPTVKLGLTGIFLDPPYSTEADRDDTLYGVEDLNVAHDVRAWCVEHGDNPLLRIALCGYAGEHDDDLIAAGWQPVAWKAAGGYGSQGNGRGRENSKREVVWFSPHCIKDDIEQRDFDWLFRQTADGMIGTDNGGKLGL